MSEEGPGLRLDNPLVVQWEYASEERLRIRNAVYRDVVEGDSAEDVALAAVAEASPRGVLDAGCGTGEFARRIADETGAEVVAVDLSPRMVELARAAGLEARVADIQSLPFDDGEFDCVVANWVMHHLPDLDRGVAELARVLRRRGRAVVTTIARDNLEEVWDLVGVEAAPPHKFFGEQGADALAGSFASVETRPARGTASFANASAVRRFVAASITRAHLAAKVPDFGEELRARSSHLVFVAEKGK